MRVTKFLLIIVSVGLITACSSQRSVTEPKTVVKKELSESKQQQYYYLFLEANRKKLLGDFNSALALYYQCLEINSNGAGAMSEISRIQQIMKNYDTAIKYAKLATENAPENKWYKVNLAKLYISTENYQDAADVYEQAYSKDKSDLETAYNLAALAGHLQNYERAIELYNDIERKVGVNESLSIAKQQLYYNIGNKTKAFNEIQNLIKHYPTVPRYYGILAEMYTNDNLFIKAEENYNKLFKLDSTNALGRLSIIDFYRKKMDYDNAFLMIEKVIADDNIEFNQKVMVFVSIMNNQSEFTIYQRQIEELLKKLKTEYPDKKDSHTLYADYLIKSNQLEEAKMQIEYILDNYEGNQVLWQQLLSIYSFNGDFESLYARSQVAIDSFPKHALFYLFKGIAANQTNKPNKAIETLKTGIKTIQNDTEMEVDFYTNLGEAYHHAKMYKESDYYFEMVLNEQPDNLYVINNYSYFLSLREQKLEYAESISKRTILAEPNNETYLDTYAWILYKLERYEDALLYIKQAFENGGDKSDVIVEHYGDIQFKVGNIEAAVKLWEMAKEMGSTSEALLEKIEKRSLN